MTWIFRSKKSSDASQRLPMWAAVVSLACAAAPSPSLVPVEDGRLVMGTVLDLSLLVEAGEELRAREAIARAFAEVASLAAVASRFHPQSDVSRLNAGAGQGASVIDSRVHAMLVRAVRAWRATQGAFDVSVGPLVALWTRAAKWDRVPSPDDIRLAVALVGQPAHLEADHRAVLPSPGMSIDLGGIAKGFALDAVATDLGRAGFERGLLSFGQSSIWALGAPADAPAWRLAVRGHDGEIVGTLDLSDQALSVSSSLGQSSEIEGRLYGHVVDPRTGQDLVNRRRAIVVTQDATWAEVLSTALLVLDEAEATAVLAEQGAQALVIDEQGRHWNTAGWQAATGYERR